MSDLFTKEPCRAVLYLEFNPEEQGQLLELALDELHQQGVLPYVQAEGNI